jgi:RNA polymerase sigma-70 factor (ECF subfamily)
MLAREAADDAGLLAAAQRGDHAAFTSIIARHARLVHGYLRARLARLADAEDLGQEVFLRVYTAKAVPREGAGVAMRPWLIGIARNVLREHARAARRRRETAWTELCLDIEDLAGAGANDGGASRRSAPAPGRRSTFTTTTTCGCRRSPRGSSGAKGR